MGNQQKILDAIINEAKAEADAIVNDAKNKAEAIVKDAKNKAEAERNAAFKIAKDEADKAYAKEISGAEMKAKKMILAIKQDSIANVVNSVKERLNSYSIDEYCKFILLMIENAGVEKGALIVLPSKGYDKIKEELTKKGYKVEKSLKDFDGGFVVVNGSIEYNYSFESILSAEKEEIEQISAKILFN